METNIYRWNTKVLFGDIDFYGVVYYLRYFDWCTQAREHFILGHLPEELNKTCPTVHEVFHKFHRPARLNDNISIEVNFQDVRRASVQMNFHIHCVARDKKELLGVHQQKILFQDREGKITRMSPELYSVLKRYEAVACPAECLHDAPADVCVE